MKRKYNGLKNVTYAILAGVLLSGCSSDDSSPTAPSSSVRALHLSEDAPAVDVAVDDAVVVEDASYRQASGFLKVKAGERNVKVQVANTTTAVIDADIVVNALNRYTVIAIDKVADISPLVITDSDLPAEGYIQLRVVHGAPDAPGVDVYITAPDAELAEPTLENVLFKGVSDELEVPAGDYRVRVTLNDSTDVIYDSGTISLVDGVEYIAVASSVTEGLSPIGLTVLTNIANTPVVEIDDARTRLRVVHASADAPAVDVLVNTDEVLSDVTFKQFSSYLELLGGAYDVDVAAASSGSVVIDANLTLNARNDYTVVALNALADIEALVLADDNAAPASGNIKLRLVHAAQSAGLVDIYITEPSADISSLNPSIEDFDFKDFTDYLEVAAGDYQVSITLAGTKTVAIDTGTLSLVSGGIYTALALNPAPESSDFSALLLSDNDVGE